MNRFSIQTIKVFETFRVYWYLISDGPLDRCAFEPNAGSQPATVRASQFRWHTSLPSTNCTTLRHHEHSSDLFHAD